MATIKNEFSDVVFATQRAISNIRVCSRRFGYFLIALDVAEDPDSAYVSAIGLPLTLSGTRLGRFIMTSSEVFGTREEAEAAKASREGEPFDARQWKRNPRAF